MDIFDKDLLRFWHSLSKKNVEYIMTGDIAVSLHGIPSLRPLVEIVIKDTKENREKITEAVALSIENLHFNLEERQSKSANTGLEIGGGLLLKIWVILKGLENVSFEECLSLSSVAEIENIKVPFLHINHLIANKKAVNRPKDQLDVIELEKIIQLRKEMGLD